MKKNYLMVLSAMFLGLALVLPFITGQIPQIGNMLCPMHIPVIFCGFICGKKYGLTVGFIAPLLRFLMFGMPPLLPIGIPMCFELAVYGFVSGYLYNRLSNKKLNIYVSLIGAMIAGRIVWGLVRLVLFTAFNMEFSWKLFVAGAFLNAVPGIILQIIIIPFSMMALKRELARECERPAIVENNEVQP